MSEGGGEDTGEVGYPAERAKAFADAVVAIAMTLLILPLLERVSDAGREGTTAAEWIGDEWGTILLFLTSFAVVAMFWIIHHRLFSRVTRVTGALLWLMMAWLVTIVWLPVATAMTGAFEPGPLTESVYIGSMMATSLVTVFIRLYLLRRPAVRSSTNADLRGGLAVDFSMLTLFGLALVVGILVPPLSYYPLFLLVFTSLVERVYDRMLGAPPSRRGRPVIAR